MPIASRVWPSKAAAKASPPRKMRSAAALKTAVTRPRADETSTRATSCRAVAVHVFEKAIERQAQTNEDDRAERLGKHAPTEERFVAEDTGHGGGSVVAHDRLRGDI